jgi:hypothetical protein
VSTYNGQALIITEDETEVPVTANLSSYRDGLRTAWRGALAPAPGDLQQLSNLTEGRLRLTDGTEADFLRSDTSDWVRTKRLTVIGQGEAPFSDAGSLPTVDSTAGMSQGWLTSRRVCRYDRR